MPWAEEIMLVLCDHPGCEAKSLIVNDVHPLRWWIEREQQFCPKHRPGLFGKPK